MAAVWARARVELRAHWRATVALTVLVGLVGGVVVGAAAGARRTASAFDRFLAASDAAHVTVQAFGADPALLDQIERLPQVAVAAPAAFLLVRPVGDDLQPGLEFSAAASVDGRFLSTVDRPRIIAGRAPDPEQVDEITINEELAERRGLAVGDRMAFEWLTPDQRDRMFAGEDPGPLAGPTEALRVVAIHRFPYDLVQRGLFVTPATVTPAFYRAYRDRMASFDGTTAIRLHRGEADVAAFTAAVGELSGGGAEIQILTAGEEAAKVTDAMDVLAIGLLASAAAAAVVGLVAVGLAVGRQAAAAAVDQPALIALGMTRAERTGATLAGVAPAALGGALLAVVVAVTASAALPVGLARLAEPDPGVSVDGLVLGTGFLATAVAVTAIAAAAARRSSRLPGSAGAAVLTGTGRRSTFARLVTEAGLSPTATTGVAMALEPGRGRTAVPVRSALAGAIAGLTGLAGAVTFGASLDGLVATPERYGWNWDLNVPGGGSDVEADQNSAVLAADPDVGGLASLRLSSALVGGQVLQVFGIEERKGELTYSVIEGRAPASPGEVVLGTDTLHRLGLGVGGHVEADGENGPVGLRVVGRTAFPSSDQDTLADGAGLTRAGLDRLRTTEQFTNLVLRWAPGTDAEAARSRVESRFGTTFAVVVPAEVANLARVARLPAVLGGFLAATATLAVGQAVVSGVRRRRRDLVVLRALGFVRRQVAGAVAWQAVILVTVSVIVGLPLGVAIGRWAWTALAGPMGVVVAPTVPLEALTLIVPAALLVVNLIAASPAHAAARVRPAAVLRSE